MKVKKRRGKKRVGKKKHNQKGFWRGVTAKDIRKICLPDQVMVPDNWVDWASPPGRKHEF